MFVNYFFGFFVFIFGAIIGSFLNVVLLRKNTGESIVLGGSRCFSCGKELGGLEMIPILSCLWQKGKCKNCGSRISIQYPVVELLTAVLAVLVYFKILNISVFGSKFPIFSWVFYFAAFISLFLVAAYDFKQKIIESNFLYIFGFFAVLTAILRWQNNFSVVSDDLASSFAIALFFYFMWLLSRGKWMGRGDADFAFFISLFLGFYLNIASLFLSFWVGGLLGILLLVFKGKKYSMKSEIPFGPFLALACFMVWYFSGLLNII